MLEQEIQYFASHKNDWLIEHSNKFALIKGGELIGTFNTQSEALTEAARRYGLDHYLIRRITEQEEEIKIPAFSLGILRANIPSRI